MIDEERKALWLAEKMDHISGTELAAILGVNKFSSSLDVWLSKRGELSIDDNPRMMQGRYFEDGILNMYSDYFKIPLEKADSFEFIVVDDFPLLGATLDARWVNGDRRPVDAKNPLFRGKDGEWGVSESSDFPIYYQFQLYVQMMATNTKLADLAVCFGRDWPEKYTIEYDQRVADAIKDKAEKWWNKHIIKGIQPEPDGSDSCTRYINGKFKKTHKNIFIPSTPETIELVSERKKFDKIAKDANFEKASIDNKLKSIIGNYEGIEGLVTWKQNVKGNKVFKVK